MRAITILIITLLLLHLSSPWCLKTMANLTSEVTRIDYSPDGTKIVVTSTSANTVAVYDTTNFFNTFTFTPSSSTVNVARFSKDGTYIGVGLSSGRVELISGNAPFSNTVLFNFQPRGNNIIDLDFNNANDKMVLCYSDDNRFEIVDNYDNDGTRADRSEDMGDNSFACRFSMNDDVVISTNNK